MNIFQDPDYTIFFLSKIDDRYNNLELLNYYRFDQKILTINNCYISDDFLNNFIKDDSNYFLKRTGLEKFYGNFDGLLKDFRKTLNE